MAGNIGSKYYNIFLDYQIWLTKKGESEVLTHEHFLLIDAVNRKQSLALAAEDMSISYRKAWGMIKLCESQLGFTLIESKRGGSDGGSSCLSLDGERLLKAYLKLKVEMDNMFKENVKQFFHSINQ